MFTYSCKSLEILTLLFGLRKKQFRYFPIQNIFLQNDENETRDFAPPHQPSLANSRRVEKHYAFGRLQVCSWTEEKSKEYPYHVSNLLIPFNFAACL